MAASRAPVPISDVSAAGIVVSLLSGAAIPIAGPGFLFAAAQAAPGLSQAPSSTASAGAPMSIVAQSTTAASSTGGALNLASGGGTTAAGAINFQPGGTTLISILGGGGFSVASGAQFPGITVASTTNASSTNFVITPQASTATNGTPGNMFVALANPTGTSTTYPGLYISQGGTSQVALGCLYPGAPSLGGLWLGLAGAAPSASNYAIIANSNGTVLNHATSLSFRIAGNPILGIGATITSVVPIVGDSGNNSPYGVHGIIVSNLTASRAATAAEYAMTYLIVSPNAGGFTLTMPAPASGAAGYWKIFSNPSANGFTLSTGAGTTILVAAGTSKAMYWFDNSGVR